MIFSAQNQPWANGVANLQTLAEQWLRDCVVNNTPKTVAQKWQVITKFLWWGKISRPAQINLEILQNFVGEYLLANYPVSTTLQRWHCLTGFLGWLEERGLLAANPARRVKLPRLVREDPKFLTDEEIRQLFIWAKYQGRLLEVEFFFYTGCRFQEGRQARWEWLDLDNKILRISAASNHSRRRRAVPLHDSLLETLRVVRGPGPELLFPGIQGPTIPRCRDHWNDIAGRLRAQVPAFSGWHILRHTYATRLARAGVPMQLISAWLGHSSFDTTLHFYANLQQDNYSPQINKL